MRIVPVVTLFVAAWALAIVGAAAADGPAPLLPYRVVAEYPHDTRAFTEGLVLDGQGRLVESEGRYNGSAIVLWDPHSGKVLRRTPLEPRYFGEGATIVGNHIVQLTWRENTGFVYDFDLKQTGSFKFTGDGWGLTYDGKRLIQSDGSANLYFLDPQTYQALDPRYVKVHDGDRLIDQLNELEYVDGKVYANVWHSNLIAVIDLASGTVRNWIDLSALAQSFPKPANWDPDDDVLNGIAYDPRNGHFYVTGKCWPKLFEIAVGQ
jgi:glutaminyl-peptide cyclotransferase